MKRGRHLRVSLEVEPTSVCNLCIRLSRHPVGFSDFDGFIRRVLELALEIFELKDVLEIGGDRAFPPDLAESGS